MLPYTRAGWGEIGEDVLVSVMKFLPVEDLHSCVPGTRQLTML